MTEYILKQQKNYFLSTSCKIHISTKLYIFTVANCCFICVPAIGFYFKKHKFVGFV